MAELILTLRTQALKQGGSGRHYWQEIQVEKAIEASRTALLLCDVWDRHWSRGATERVEAMAPRMDQVVAALRARGVQIIHAPSDTMEFYAGTPARLRMSEAPAVDAPPPLAHADPPLPVDASDGGSDTGEKPWFKAWGRQHPAIQVDPDRDGISDSGPEIHSFMRSREVGNLILMGVHTNMCILGRSFGIKQMVRWGIPVMLVRDLTDAMYNPAMPPYVSHDEGTRLVIGYIEKFWCPTVLSQDLLRES